MIAALMPRANETHSLFHEKCLLGSDGVSGVCIPGVSMGCWGRGLSVNQIGLAVLITYELRTWHCHLLQFFLDARSTLGPLSALLQQSSATSFRAVHSFCLQQSSRLAYRKQDLLGPDVSLGSGGPSVCVFLQGLLKNVEFLKLAAAHSVTRLVCNLCLLSVATERVRHLLFIRSLVPQHSFLGVQARLTVSSGEAQCLL